MAGGQYDWDTVIDHSASSSSKWYRYADSDILPMWVADMDFPSPPPVLQALRDRVEHGVFGYTRIPDHLTAVALERLRQRHGWEVDADWLLWLPGMVVTLNVFCRAMLQRGSRIAVARPIYRPFRTAPANQGLECVEIPLLLEAGRWVLDFNALETAAREGLAAFLLCNPQNPGGTVWTLAELQQLATICSEHGVQVCADEIHCDLILDPDARHLSFATIDDWAADNSATLCSPSKTFNLAGIGCALAVVPNRELRVQMRRALAGIVGHVSLFGASAAAVAWEACEDWRRELIAYLRGNHQLLLEGLNAHDCFDMQPLQATYLAWVDAAGLELPDPQRWFEGAGVGSSPGSEYRAEQFVRINFGCPRSLVEQALERIATAL